MDPEKEKAFQAMLTGFPELLNEQADASKVKQQVPILIILGNPPYNAFAGTATTKEEKESIAPYKEGLIKKWGIKKFNLDELYVRFFRMAERRIAEQTGRGVVCFISNFSYLSDPSFVVMREHFLKEFDQIWFDNMNGDSRETGKRTPEGKPDPSVFSTEYNREGIRVGTTVSLLVRKRLRSEKQDVLYKDFWGETKRADLLNSLNAQDLNTSYKFLTHEAIDRYLFRTLKASQGYMSWPSIQDFAEQKPFPAFMESRCGAFININKDALKGRMQAYYDKQTAWETLEKLGTGLTRNAAGYDALKAREKTLKKETYNSDQILRYSVRPFDTQWCYYTKASTLWHRSRPELWAQCWAGNSFIVTRLKTEKEAKGSPLYFSRCLVDCQSLARNVSVIPIGLRDGNAPKVEGTDTQIQLLDEQEYPIRPNLSMSARNYLTSLGIELGTGAGNATFIWMHTLAIGYSPTYFQENGDNIRVNWPRIPLPNTKPLLESSAELGENIAALLDTEKPVSGVTASPIRPEIQTIAVITREDGGQLQPKELAVTVANCCYTPATAGS
jgi:predicted helicase